MYSLYISKVLEMAVSTTSATEIMRCFIEASIDEIQVSNILYFKVNAENKIELISSYGEALASLENYKFISRDRILPVPESINGGIEIYVDSPAQLLEKYDEAKSWKELPQALVAIPVVKLGVTMGCAVFSLDKQINSLEYQKTIETFRAFAFILELLKVHEFSGSLTLKGSKDEASYSETLKRQERGLLGSAEKYTHAPGDNPELKLTERQHQIAILIASGETNSTIARTLGYSAATIRYETVKLYERLRVKNRSQASSRIQEMGIS